MYCFLRQCMGLECCWDLSPCKHYKKKGKSRCRNKAARAPTELLVVVDTRPVSEAWDDRQQNTELGSVQRQRASCTTNAIHVKAVCKVRSSSYKVPDNTNTSTHTSIMTRLGSEKARCQLGTNLIGILKKQRGFFYSTSKKKKSNHLSSTMHSEGFKAIVCSHGNASLSSHKYEKRKEKVPQAMHTRFSMSLVHTFFTGTLTREGDVTTGARTATSKVIFLDFHFTRHDFFA